MQFLIRWFLALNLLFCGLISENGLEGNTAQDLEFSLASASPEVQQCVSSCKHIAESAKHQNDFQSVSDSSRILQTWGWMCLSFTQEQ